MRKLLTPLAAATLFLGASGLVWKAQAAAVPNVGSRRNFNFHRHSGGCFARRPLGSGQKPLLVRNDQNSGGVILEG